MLLHDESIDAVEARDARYIVSTYARTRFHPRKGQGAKLVDAQGKVYWDLLAGIAVNALGYSHPAVNRVMKEESTALLHCSNLFYHPAQGILAEKLVRGSMLSKVFFCNSGTEANEAAIKFARLATPGRSGIVALVESFHGRTFGALSATGHDAYREPFAPLLPGVTFVPANDVEALAKAVDASTSAILLEPVQGEGGVIPLTDEFLQTARRVADLHGAMLIFDEVQCGLGRLGTLFAFQKSGVVPDMVTLAKPLGGGLPLGCVVTGPALDGAIKPGHHGTTFGGNPLACRLGAVVLDELEKGLLQKIERTGEWFGAQLRALQSEMPAIVDVRGSGLMWGIELDRPAGPVAARLREEGFLVGTAREHTIRLLPPYIVPKKALSEFLGALRMIIAAPVDNVVVFPEKKDINQSAAR